MNEFDKEKESKFDARKEQAKELALEGKKHALSFWATLRKIIGKIIAWTIAALLITGRFLSKTANEIKESKKEGKGGSSDGFGGGYVDHDMPSFAEHRRPENRNSFSSGAGSSTGGVTGSRTGKTSSLSSKDSGPSSSGGGSSFKNKTSGRR